MLFDLRGRGRRRTVQVIYLTLALLMGGGLVFFGIGGATNGGLLDAFGGGGNDSGSNDAFEKRVADLEKRSQVNPSDTAAWAGLVKAYYQVATTGENFDSNTQAFTTKGLTELRSAERAWDRYVALTPNKIDPSVANIMTRAFGPGGLERYPKAVQAMEVVIDSSPTPTFQQYYQLSLLAHAAKQDRKSTLASDKAVELAPKAQRDAVRTQLQQAKTQLDNLANAEQPTGS